MHLLIPSLKSKLILDRDWTFDLYDEYRNESGAKYFGVYEDLRRMNRERNDKNQALRQQYLDEHPDTKTTYRVRIPGVVYGHVHTPITLPKGSVLIVDRIYIRNGGSEYDSITFRLAETPTEKPKGKKSLCRFWAKLRDVNQIHIIDTRDLLFGEPD